MSLEPEGGHEEEHSIISDNYFDMASQVDRLLASDPQVGSNRSQSYSTSDRPKRKLELPEVKIPTFSGKYEEWLSFEDKFETLVHDQPDLELSEKMFHLSSALVREAQAFQKNQRARTLLELSRKKSRSPELPKRSQQGMQ